MNKIVEEIEVAKAEGCDWLKRSLGAGSDVSTTVSTALTFSHGRFTTFIPVSSTPDRVRFPEHGFVGETVGNAGLAQYLDALAHNGAACVVIEDDILGRADQPPPGMTVPSAFVGDNVVHWSNLKPTLGAVATKAIRESAFGYPLNAFVVMQSSAELGLADGQSAPVDFAKNVAGSLLAVVVSAFDAESFMTWTAEPDATLPAYYSVS